MSEVTPRGPCMLVAPYDVEPYADAMRELVRAPQRDMLAQGELCRHAARRYSWDAVALEQETFYQSVAAEQKH